MNQHLSTPSLITVIVKSAKMKKRRRRKRRMERTLTGIDSSSSLSNRAPPQLVHSAKLATLVVLELPMSSLTHSQGRGLSDDEVRNALGKHIISANNGLMLKHLQL